MYAAAPERRALLIMGALYCAARHGEAARDREGLCAACARTVSYALSRAASCRYGAGKPVCGGCPTPCYSPAMRDAVRGIMRYSGPRMALRHPLLALAHAFRALRRPKAAEPGC